MAITWTKLIPRWGGDTIEPPEAKKDTGYIAGDKPPAKWENWLRKGTYEALDETRDVIENIDSQLTQIVEDVAGIPTIIDESLGGAKIRDNNGVLETLVGSVWIPILKEGDVMPILPNMIQAARNTPASIETNYVTMLNISDKKGILRNIAAAIAASDRYLLTFKITVDGVLQTFKEGTLTNTTEPGFDTLVNTFNSSALNQSSLDLDLQFKQSVKVEAKYAKAQILAITITALTE